MNRQQLPCVYPGCDEGRSGDEREPRLTYNVICNPCRRRFAKLIGWVVMDYVSIKSNLELPSRRGKDGSKYERPKAKSFGHPAERASLQATEIADHLNLLEHDLRDHLGDGAAVHPRVNEMHRVKLAYEYLTWQRFNELCTHPAAGDLAEALKDLHGKNRSMLGLTRFVEHLDTVPCPTCAVHALTRSVGQIDCASCGRVIEEDMYPFLVRILIDDIIDAYDTQHAEERVSDEPVLTV